MRWAPLAIVLLLFIALPFGVVAAEGAATDAEPWGPDPLPGAVSSATHDEVSDQPTAVLSVLENDMSSVTGTSSETTLAIQLRADGAAEWNVSVRYELTDDADRAAFEEYAAAFEDGEEAIEPGVDTFTDLLERADAETDRGMSIESVERTSQIDEGVGTLRLEFVWTEFLTDEGDRLVLDDVFYLDEDDNQRWLTTLRADQELVIHAPEEYSIVRSTVSFEDNTVTKQGPHQFDAEEHISMAFERTAANDQPPNGDDLPPPPNGTDWTDLGWVGVIAIVGLAIVLAVAVLLFRRREPAEESPGDATASTPAGDDTTASAVTRDETDSEAATVADDRRPASEEPVPKGVPESDVDEPLTDEELALLSDEERVERLLEANGGRMRQATIVSETGWSDAKVSQLLSSMAEEGRIEKLRLGRENLISLPGHSPVADPHDDEPDGDTQ